MQWYENELFWEDTFPLLFGEPLWKRAANEVEKCLQLTGHRGGPVLDFCCGPGRHLIELAKRGISATGVDKSAHLLEKARRTCDEHGVAVELVNEDVRTFVRKGAFETALSLFTSIGYFEDRSDDVLLLRNMRESLIGGGYAVVDVLGKEIWAKLYPVDDIEGPDGMRLRMRWEAYDDWSRIRHSWTVRRGEHHREHVISSTVYSGRELKEAMELAGFRSIKLYGNYDGAPYDHDATRLIAVGQAPS